MSCEKKTLLYSVRRALSLHALLTIYIYFFFFRKLFMRLGGPEVLDSSSVFSSGSFDSIRDSRRWLIIAGQENKAFAAQERW